MSIYSYDKTLIVGKAGRDAEMRFLPNGTAVTSFSVAVDRSFKKDGEQVKRTIWYRVSVFGNFAEVCAKIHKGDNLLVEGELTPDWNTGNPKVFSKQDGTSGASYELTASTVRFMGSKVSEAAHDGDGQATFVDDIPF